MTLKPHEDREVVQATMALTKANDSLSAALAVDPTEFQIGETVHVVLECEVVKVSYEEMKGTDALRRVHTLKADLGSIIEKRIVAKTLAEQRKAIAAMLEAESNDYE